MNEVYFKETNFVGKEIKNVQELIKALDAGLYIADGDGYMCTKHHVEEYLDENGDYYEKDEEYTDEELFDIMRHDLDKGHALYCGFFLDESKFELYPSKATTLQCDFSVGKSVYFLRDNKIQAGEIRRLWLQQGVDCQLLDNTRDIATQICAIANDSKREIGHYAKMEVARLIDDVRIIEESCALVRTKTSRRSELVPLSAVFATKEELAEHLIRHSND